MGVLTLQICQCCESKKGGANYIYSVLVGYEDPPPGFNLDEGVYYNKYMIGNKIKMPNNLMDGLVNTQMEQSPLLIKWQKM